MARLTLVIDDDLLTRARMRALAHGTSVNAVVREMLANDAADERVLALLEDDALDIVLSAHVLNEFYCQDSPSGSDAAPPPRQASASAERITSAQRATRSSLRSASLSSSMTRPTN